MSCAALASAVEQFSSMLTWTARQVGSLDHGERETVIGTRAGSCSGSCLEATFSIDSAREERVQQVTSTAGIRQGTVEKGHERGRSASSGGAGRAGWPTATAAKPTCTQRTPWWMLPDDPYSLCMRALAAYYRLACGGYWQAQEVIEARTGVKIGPAQLAGLGQDLAAGVDDFYAWRASGADAVLPYSDVIMMQADGKGIAMRPEHRASAGKETSAAHPGI